MKNIFPFRFILILSFLFSINMTYGQDLMVTFNNNIVCQFEEFQIFIAGGQGPYVTNWGDGSTTITDQGVDGHSYFSTGIFEITVSDQANNESNFIVQINSCNDINIFGNFDICVGDCEFFEVDGGSPPYIFEITSATGNVIGNTQSNCWNVPGEYTFVVFDANGNSASVNFVVSGGAPVDIVSLSNTFCATDSINSTSCEKICANSTAIYTIPNGQNVVWEILGADDFTASGNQVSVDWGAPGSGVVTATASIGGSNLSVHCGSTIVQGANGFEINLDAIGSGTAGPYIYSWSGPNGLIFTTPNPTGLPLSPGTYQVVVTDGQGNTASCETHVVSEPGTQTCLFSYTVIGQNESECDICDGSATIDISSPLSNSYAFQWATGETTQSISGLCSGTYGVTIIDVNNCEASTEVTIGCSSFSSCPSTTSICVDILEEPEANVTTIPPAVNGVVSICEGGTVVFNNESLGASSYEWSFGNGNVSTNVNAEQTYLTSGSYEVYLISRNDCYCSDTTFLTIDVADAISPSLDCVGTICENETVTYSTDATCGTFTWNITGDYNIVDGGTAADNFITIEWLTGPEGIIELSVGGCSGGNFCLEPTVEVVPIISDNATIKGPGKVCRYDESTYFIDDYTASDFTWTVSPGGTLLEGQNTNSIKVLWDGVASSTAQRWVAVDYTNCYLGCGGSDTKDVYILPEMYLEGEIEACENGMSTHFAKKDNVGVITLNCNWTVTAGDGSVVWTSPSPANTINLDWSTIAIGSGRYAITAVAANPLEVCSDDFTSYINLIQSPSAPTSIDGVTQICPGEFYTYQVNTTNPDYIFNWTINDGGNISTQTGSSINVSFGNTPPYTLSVTQTSTDGLACESSATSLDVFPITTFTAFGDSDVCVETEGNYAAQLFEGVSYIWEIIPSDAGTILEGQNTNAVKVFWHQSGNAEVVANMCNVIQTVPVNVIAKPTPVIDGDLFLCPGETTIVGTTTPYNTYQWITESGNLITNAATVELPVGVFELVVTNSFGCENNIAFEVVGYPTPEVSISVFGSRGRCYQGTTPDAPAEIHAMEVPAGYTYQWYYQGSPIAGSNSSILTSSDFGTFQVSALDQNGCETFSNIINIFSFCSGSGGGGGPPVNNPPVSDCGPGTDVVMNFTVANECNKFNFFNNSANIDLNTISWDFGDPASGLANVSNAENPAHTFSGPGHYVVTFEAENPQGVVCWDTRIVTVPITANFSFGNACVNEALVFEDLSGFVPGETVDTWTWDFGEPSSGANNTSTDQNPSHVYSSPGTFNVTLIVGHASGCDVTISKTVNVEIPPTINFAEPTLNCQGTALSFIAQPSADVLFYDWNFGEPTSGAANTSTVQDPFHAYETSGNFTVECTVTDIWGCTASFSRVINVTPNSLNGNITFSTPSPICDGDVTTLTAPPGGVSWEWSDGSTNETLTTGEAGAYSVTITNNIGCQYVAPIAVLDIIPLPSSAIQAVEYDEFGQPVNVFYDNYSTCEGEDVFLQVVNNASYSYTWTGGIAGNELEFSEDRGNQLTAGTYTISLDIVDNSTGCMNTVGPFNIVIHPTPTGIQISSNPVGPVCENNLTTLTVDNPQVDLTYVWNTGEISNNIQVSAGGEYFVRGISTFGCIGESNKIEILPGPDIKKIPDGCHTRCKPDTICLPTINGISSYQWYLDGAAIPGPNGMVGDLIAQESGAYHVVMTDIYGCETSSDILNLDLFDGFGTFNGNVYMDVNENGIIDGPDTLVNGVDIILTENGVALDTTTSAMDGSYSFPNILSTDYNLQVDVNGLPGNVIAVYNNIDTSLVGCNDEEVVDWLLQINCPPLTNSINESICDGDQFIYEGAVVTPGVPTDFTLESVWGCDSVVTVTITQLPDFNTTTTLSTCGGNDVTYNGSTLAAGSVTDFSMMSPEGCPFTETVEVISSPTSSENLVMEVCVGEVAMFDGTSLTFGLATEFPYLNQFGCDSIITVTAIQLPDLTTTTTLNACAGGDIFYNGIVFPTGSVTELNLISPDGCDYIETVEVAPFPTSSESLSMEFCVDEVAMFDGTLLTFGIPTEFPYLNQFGCDSIITVTATQLPDLTTTTSLNTCGGNDVTYNGSTLAAGSITDFSMVSPDGCNYIETVEVISSPTSSENLAMEVCVGEVAMFDGTQLIFGMPTEFPYLNQFGCDSIITVTATQLPDLTAMTTLNACAGGDITYNGIVLPAGSITELELTSPDGCDYIETVEVAPFPTSSESLSMEVCAGEVAMFDGTQLVITVPTEFAYLNQFGCDSIITVTAIELPDLTTTTLLNACDGNDVIYNGMTLIAGSQTDFPMVSPDGCDYIETVEVVPFPTNSANLELEVCSGEIAMFDGQELTIGSLTEFSYLNQFGCDSIVMVNVIAFPDIQFDVQTDIPCWNASDGAITIMNTSGTGPLEFSLDGTAYQAAPIFEDLTSNNYMLYVKDANGCEMEEPVTLNAIPPLQVEVLASLLPCDGGNANLQTQILSGNASNVTYVWSDGSTDPEISVADAGLYFVSATNECETITEEVNVSYEDQERTSYVYIPNAFSPNGDGYNDILRVLPSNEIVVEAIDFYIFDRWGNHLYETHNVDEGWNGKLNNKALDPNVYVYYMRADITTCGRTFEIFRKGDVTIMK